jgi:hypothetical protein
MEQLDIVIPADLKGRRIRSIRTIGGSVRVLED